MFARPWSRRFKWLAGVSAVYSIIALLAIFTGYFAWVEFIELAWIVILALPLWIKPLGRWIELDKPIPDDQW